MIDDFASKLLPGKRVEDVDIITVYLLYIDCSHLLSCSSTSLLPHSSLVEWPSEYMQNVSPLSRWHACIGNHVLAGRIRNYTDSRRIDCMLQIAV